MIAYTFTALSSLTGVVSFPSFHTTMALAYAYGFRRAGAIGWIVGALNFVMLFSIPFFGGHYLVDMIAGVLMAILIGWIWRYLMSRLNNPMFFADRAAAQADSLVN